jgi:hypothetical protein
LGKPILILRHLHVKHVGNFGQARPELLFGLMHKWLLVSSPEIYSESIKAVTLLHAAIACSTSAARKCRLVTQVDALCESHLRDLIMLGTEIFDTCNVAMSLSQSQHGQNCYDNNDQAHNVNDTVHAYLLCL